ncbi:hypothetical protein Bca52824_096748, partial [Brassica carinata]
TTSVLGSSYSPVTSTASLLSVQQRVYILLKESLRRADTLKLRRLVASNHLAMAKFELMHVQRPLLSFGPKASVRHKTCPVSVCKEIRLGAHLLSDFSAESSTMTIDGSLSSVWLKDLQNHGVNLCFLRNPVLERVRLSSSSVITWSRFLDLYHK